MKLITQLGLNNIEGLMLCALEPKARCRSTTAMLDQSLPSHPMNEEHARQQLNEYQGMGSPPRDHHRGDDRTQEGISESETDTASLRVKGFVTDDNFGQRTVLNTLAVTWHRMKTGIWFLWLGIVVFLVSTCWLPEAIAKPGLNQPQASISAKEKAADSTENLEKKAWSRSTDIYFAKGSPKLTAKDKIKLNRLVEGHQDQIEVIIAVGHSSAHEAERRAGRVRSSYLQTLSDSRAKAVQVYLTTRSVERNRIYIEGKGANQPQLDERNLKSRRRNRRVEVEGVFAKYETIVPSAQSNR